MTDIRFRPVFPVFLAALAFLATSLTAGAEELFPELVPSPSLAPDEVVRIQLGALAKNDSPRLDAGIEVTFRFASPDNRKKTGPLPRFIELVKNPVYAPMINHKAAEYGGAFEKDDHVLVPVMLTGSDDGKAAYIFVLGRQNVDACKGCWMTESVFRVRVDEAGRKSRTIRIGA